MRSFYSTKPFGNSVPLGKGRSSVLIEPRRKKSPLHYFLEYPYRAYMVALVLGLVLSAANAWAQDALPEVRQQGDVSYISGGIGDDETQALDAVKNDYNLRITSADRSGHYHGETRIIVRDAMEAVLLDTISQGPMLYANLPKGRYTVYGYSEGQSKIQKVTIANGKASRVHFSWAQKVTDNSNNASLRNDMNLTHDSY